MLCHDHESIKLRFYYQDPRSTEENFPDEEFTGGQTDGQFGVAQPQVSPEETDTQPPYSEPTGQPSYGRLPKKQSHDAVWSWLHARKRNLLARKEANLAKRAALKTTTQQVGRLAVRRGIQAASLLTGVGGVAVNIGLVAAEGGLFIWKHRKIFTIINVCLIVLCAIVILQAWTQIGTLLHGGANTIGGSALQAQEDSYAPAIAGVVGGTVVANSMETLNTAVGALTKIVTTNPPSGARAEEAKQILSRITELQGKLRANSYNNKQDAIVVNQYKQLVQQLFDALYPGRKSVQTKVLSLVGSRIQLQTAGGCATDKDLRGLGLTEKLLNVIYAGATNTPLTITCLITGHRKYVGNPPPPRCGDAASLSVTQSLHCLGRAVDFSPNPKLEQFLLANKSQLQIKSIGDEGDHLHVEVFP